MKNNKSRVIFIIFCLFIPQMCILNVMAMNSMELTAISSNSKVKNLETLSSTFSVSNITCISDNSSNWNPEDLSYSQDIAVDSSGNVHIVWSDHSDGWWGSDMDILYSKYTVGVGWSVVTAISDDATLWNTGDSYNPSIAIDTEGIIHVVWQENTNGWWGTDAEIMYASCTGGIWSNGTLLSDDGSLWNNATSGSPDLDIDDQGSVHVVWTDFTLGIWGGGGSDQEIMYSRYSKGFGWTTPTVISDGYNGEYWNNLISQDSHVAADSLGNVHVIWHEYTNGWWGTDQEIMYTKHTTEDGWENGTILSDSFSLWNDGDSSKPNIAIDNNDNIYVLWQDTTDGIWGVDIEIMGIRYSAGFGWSGVGVISDDDSLWNIGSSSTSPSLSIGPEGKVHAVWVDGTNGWWETDNEIMYSSFSTETGWSNATVISDDITNWNNDTCEIPEIGVDGNGNVHVSWNDFTDGVWGSDEEILYCKITYDSTDSSPPRSGTPQLDLLHIILIVSLIGLGIALMLLIPYFYSKGKSTSTASTKLKSGK